MEFGSTGGGSKNKKGTPELMLSGPIAGSVSRVEITFSGAKGTES